MNADEVEIRKFDKLGETWWDPKGEMGSLHQINPLRMEFIQDKCSLQGARVLDVGCGGGILAEALAEAGAQVLGVDLSRLSLGVAKVHAQQRRLSIQYECESAEETALYHPGEFDLVTCLEMLEHVPNPEKMIGDCAQTLKPGGHFFCSTVNRTWKAFLFAIIGGEYILHLLPRGSHRYGRLIRPVELRQWTGKNKLAFESSVSFEYDPLQRRFATSPGKVDVNYMMHFIKESN